MIANALTRTEAMTYYTALLQTESYEPTLDETGSGKRDDFAVAISSYRELVDGLLEEFGGRDDLGARLEMDAKAAGLIHAALPIEDGVAGDDGFWRYLALCETWPLIAWRHGRNEEGELRLAADHVGLGGKWECLPKRLWLRGELSWQADDEDPYALTRRGGSDFWVSGVVRHAYSGARPVVRALVRFQYPEEGRFTGAEYRPQTLTLTGVRNYISACGTSKPSSPSALSTMSLPQN